MFEEYFNKNCETTETTLGEICKCELGGTPSRTKPEYWGGKIPWINSGEVNNFRIIKPSEYITETGLEKSATKLLPQKTTVIAITGATLGQVSLLEISSCANQSVVGVLPNNDAPYEFIYPFIKSSIKELVSHQTGGAQQHINKQNVEQLMVKLPSKKIMLEYRDKVKSIYQLISNNCFENQYLSQLRDTLLPKLMSGEIDVSKVNISADKLSFIVLFIQSDQPEFFVFARNMARLASPHMNYCRKDPLVPLPPKKDCPLYPTGSYAHVSMILSAKIGQNPG